MSVYMTETEQLEAIKKWWKRYNNVIIVSLSVILFLMSGYKYWNWHREKINQQASMAYEHLMLAFSNQDNRGVRAFANQLITDYSQTVYADAAHLTLAKLYVAREKYSAAKKELHAVLEHSKMDVLQELAKIRLARLLATEKSYDLALNELNKIDSTAYLPLVNELRGDILEAKGLHQEAVASYREALSQVQKKGMGNLFLEMKTTELLALTHSMKKEENNTKTVV